MMKQANTSSILDQKLLEASADEGGPYDHNKESIDPVSDDGEHALLSRRGAFDDLASDPGSFFRGTAAVPVLLRRTGNRGCGRGPGSGLFRGTEPL